MDKTDRVKLISKARKLEIPEYRGLSTAELQAAVEAAENGTTVPAKAKAVVKKAVSKAPTKAATKAADKEHAKRLGVVKKTPAKSAPVKKAMPVAKKSAPAKSKSAAPKVKASAKGDQAKRPNKTELRAMAKESTQANIAARFGVSVPTVGKWYKDAGIVSKRGRRSGSTNGVAKVKPSTNLEANGVFANRIVKGKYSPRERYNVSATKTIRNFIDPSNVNWNAEWSGGKSGARGEVLTVVRKTKGNNNAAFAILAERASELFPRNSRTGKKLTKEEALRYLRWFISRVKFDFVAATGQHKPSKKAGDLVKAGMAKRSKPVSAPKKAKAGKTPTKVVAKAKKGSQAVSKASKPGKRGRPKGIPMSEETKAKIAATRKKTARAKARAAKAAA